MTMKALVYTGTQEVEYRDENKPVPGPNQALIEVAATAICGSDMHAYHGLDERRVPPLILGHEVAGKLVSGAAHLMDQQVAQMDFHPQLHFNRLICQQSINHSPSESHYHMRLQ